MAGQDPQKITIRIKRPVGRLMLLGLLLAAAFALALQSHALESVWAYFKGDQVQASGPPMPASSHKLTQQELNAILRLPAQRQAEDLLQDAVNHYEGAPEAIQSLAEGWRGRLAFTKRISDLDSTARYSNDLRVRAASTELLLVVFNYPKTPAMVDKLIAEAKNMPSARAHVMWALGMLGNRAVETERVLHVLQSYVDDPDEQVQIWSIEGIAIAGTPASIPILLRIFHDGTSYLQRERAGCGLAKSGSFTQQERMLAVPKLVEFVERADVDQTTVSMFYQALREITNLNLGNDPAAWRKWLNEGGAAHPYGDSRVAGNS